MFKLGFIGFGFVNSAVAYAYSTHAQIKIWDKYKNDYDTLEETVNESDILFVSVPTPMDDNGVQDLSSLYDAILSVNNVAESPKIIVIKSTVIPGTTRKLAEEYEDHSFVFNPEFLTERAAKLEFINANRVVLGGDDSDALDKVEKLYRILFRDYVPIFKTNWEGAEVVKYMTNCFFAMKISFLNEIYDISQHIDVPYEELAAMWQADFRFGNSHTQVPGHDGSRGYGGKCFPKDVRAFFNWAEENGLKADMCRATDKVNNRVRKDKDWLNITGATTGNDYEDCS